MLKSYEVFLYFHNCWNLIFGPTGTCYQESSLVLRLVRGIVVESSHRIATNNILAVSILLPGWQQQKA